MEYPSCASVNGCTQTNCGNAYLKGFPNEVTRSTGRSARNSRRVLSRSCQLNIVALVAAALIAKPSQRCGHSLRVIVYAVSQCTRALEKLTRDSKG